MNMFKFNLLRNSRLLLAFIILVIFSCSEENKKVKPGYVSFFETYSYSELSSNWQQANELSKKLLNKEDTVAESKEININLSKGLTDYIKNIGLDFCIGYVEIRDKQIVESLLKRKDILAFFPKNLKFMWSSKPEKINSNSNEKFFLLYACRIPLNGKSKVSGKDISKASSGYDSNNGQITINIKLTNKGSYKFALMTSENINRCIAITIDNQVLSCPRVIQSIKSGDVQISGNFTVEEAEELTNRINATNK